MATTDARVSLALPNLSRNSSRTRDAWGVNVFIDNGKLYKRTGMILDTSGTFPGQGLFVYGTSKVSIRNDVLYVDASSFSL